MPIYKKTALITGSTSGIGKAVAFELASKKYRIILLSRNMDRLIKTKNEIITVTNNPDIYTFECDLASQKQIRSISAEIRNKFPVIDVLVNNAGINTSTFEVTPDGVEKTFAVNHFAYFLLTGLLLDSIKKSDQGRVINVSSNGHKKVKLDIEKIRSNQYQGKYSTYRRSKLANVMFTIDLAERLSNTSVTVNTVHPGLIKTNIGSDDPGIIRKTVNFLKIFFAQSPEKGADTIVYLATSANVENITGRYFINRKITTPSKDVYNISKRNQLWDLSKKITNFTY